MLGKALKCEQVIVDKYKLYPVLTPTRYCGSTLMRDHGGYFFLLENILYIYKINKIKVRTRKNAYNLEIIPKPSSVTVFIGKFQGEFDWKRSWSP